MNYIVALGFASLVGTLAVTPFDNLKTRMMIQFPESAKNRVGYTSYWDCATKLF